MTEQTTTSKPKKRHKVLSILDWAPRYQRVWLRPDLIAGITVAALVVPKALGYASIAGVPIQHGLYAAAAGAILYAFFGGSGQIATGPSSALAAVAAGALVSAGIESGGEDAVQLVAAITIASGLMFLLLTIFRMGWISQFLSKPVITGFLFGAAIEVVVGELPKITGTSVRGIQHVAEALQLDREPPRHRYRHPGRRRDLTRRHLRPEIRRTEGAGGAGARGGWSAGVGSVQPRRPRPGPHRRRAQRTPHPRSA